MELCSFVLNDILNSSKMGALTLNIKSLHSSMGTSNLIEMDETRYYLIIYDGTFKNKSSRILQ